MVFCLFTVSAFAHGRREISSKDWNLFRGYVNVQHLGRTGPVSGPPSADEESLLPMHALRTVRVSAPVRLALRGSQRRGPRAQSNYGAFSSESVRASVRLAFSERIWRSGGTAWLAVFSPCVGSDPGSASRVIAEKIGAMQRVVARLWVPL